jgi:translation initiation factor 2B subunit (eIF-2B alpha/beta/delta family)
VIKSTKIPGNHCPTCKSLIDQATSVRSKKTIIKPGAFSVCCTCGEILRFNQQLRSQIATKKDLNEVLKQDIEAFMMLIKAQEIIRRDRGDRP